MSRANIIEKTKKAISKKDRERNAKEIEKMLIQAHRENPEPDLSEEEIVELLKESRQKTFEKFYGSIPKETSRSSKSSKR